MKRVLTVYFIHGLLKVKDRYKKHERWVEAGFILLLTGFYTTINYVPFMKMLIYGNEEGLVQSRSSILPLVISLLLAMGYGLYFYAGKKVISVIYCLRHVP